MHENIEIALVAEDQLSMATTERIVAASNRPFVVSRRLVERGCGNIKKSILKYKQASKVIPHIILTDLDKEPCPTALRRAWGAVDIPNTMLFRIAIREVESWLLGDRNGFSGFASIAKNKIPDQPELLEDPKRTLIDLVRRSRNKRLTVEIVPPTGSVVSIGPLYNERLTSFVKSDWDIDAATTACPSLLRMRKRLSDFLCQ